jgi:ATP-dependent DNA helicase PIF1
MNDIIEATILNVKFKGEDVLLPLIPMILTVYVVQTFAISCATRFCNDHPQSTRTSLSVCGLNLENPCFSHGQLYVACSRVGKPSDLFVHTRRKNKKYFVFKSSSINTIKTKYRVSFKLNWHNPSILNGLL